MKCINLKTYIFLDGYRIPICFSFLIPSIQRLKSLSSSAWWYSKTFSPSDAQKVHFSPAGSAGRIAGICGVSPGSWETNLQRESPSCPHSYLPILETFILENGSWEASLIPREQPAWGKPNTRRLQSWRTEQVPESSHQFGKQKWFLWCKLKTLLTGTEVLKNT